MRVSRIRLFKTTPLRTSSCSLRDGGFGSEYRLRRSLYFAHDRHRRCERRRSHLSHVLLVNMRNVARLGELLTRP
jgi:hypothetical protein